jgi:PAS domain S-box-containing protein
MPWPLLALNPLLGMVLVVLLWGEHPPLLLGGWLALLTGSSGFKYWRNRAYRRAGENAAREPTRWSLEFSLGTLLHGISWGLAGALFYNPAAPVHSMFLLVVICGVGAGCVATESAVPRAFLAFLFPALLLPAARVLLFRDAEHLLVAALLLGYMGFLVYINRANFRTLLDSVQLRFRNQSLVDAVSEREHHFRSLIENALDWVAVVRPDNTFLFHSPSVEGLLGWTPAELQERNALTHVHAEDRRQVQQGLSQVFTQGEATTIEARWHHRDGHALLLQALVSRLGGDQPVLVMNARDVTERRAAEQGLRIAKEAAEAANRIKDQFLASMSHEIRTPLHAMQGMTDLLGESPLNERQREYVAGFQEAMGHLTRLVNDVLDFSRMNAGGLALAQEPFDLHALLDGVVSLMGPRARAKGLEIRLVLAPGIGPRRRGDVVRLRQVLVNLVGNAIKFTDRGFVTIRVAESRDHLSFAVTDTGRGIPLENQGLLFRPFYQVDASSTREFGGVGLGLAISRGLVEAMGGHITVESRLGEGSTFAFFVRLPPDDGLLDLPDPGALAHLPAARLLVVDDAELNLKVMREFFRDTPCLLDFVRNGREAVAACDREVYDLIFMDIQMPEMDGWQATRAIRELERNKMRRAAPIIALTAGVLDEERSRCMEAGCTTFLSKPVTKDRLLALAAAHLENAF